MIVDDRLLDRGEAPEAARLEEDRVPAEAFGDHQEHNAHALEAAGAALVVGEERAEPRHLVAELEGLVRQPARIEALARAARHLSRPGAAARIARRLLEVGGAA